MKQQQLYNSGLATALTFQYVSLLLLKMDYAWAVFGFFQMQKNFRKTF